MNLRRLDLNLLVIFDALIQERNVTRAAERIGLSQPAVSNALSRLRYYLQDDLFVRGSTGMQPTPRAMEIACEVHQALNAIELALDPASFDPQTSERVFTIDTNDYTVSTCIPPLMQKLAKEAPNVDVRIVAPAGKAYERLDAREIDFAVGVFSSMPDRFGVTVLNDNAFAVLMRADHPLAKGRLTLKRFAACKHLLITPRGDPSGFVDVALAERGLSRRVALTVNQFVVAPRIIAASDLIVTLPKRIAALYAPMLNLVLRPSPIQPPPEFDKIELIWHKRFAQHPGHVWFRELLTEVITENAEVEHEMLRA